jgi:hypothetical protein
MKRIVLFVAAAAATLTLVGCRQNGTTDTERMNFKKLTNGKAVYGGEEAGTRRYSVTLWTNDRSTVAVDNYKEADISLALELVTAAEGAVAQIAAGEYVFADAAQAGVILASPQSTLSIFTSQSYGGDKQSLTDGRVTVSSYNGKYEIKGTVTDVWERELEFTYYGELVFEGTEPEEPTVVVTFEGAELFATTSTYTDILWGREKASEENGSQVYNGLLYTEEGASFGSYYSYDGTWESWGGFAVSSNRDLEDLGMDYSNQFAVYAPEATKFAVGYAFGEWGGQYGMPIIEFARPVTLLSADVANANKTYCYCASRPLVGEEGSEEALWVDLVVKGYDAQGEQTGSTSFRLAEGEQVLDRWSAFDLSPLGEVSRVTFAIESNDVGEWGLNVPAFFCIDNIVMK